MHFTIVNAPQAICTDPRFDESLMLRAVQEGPLACIWQARQSLVVPRTYAHAASFQAVCDVFLAQDWPVMVRHSGGGVVPQGPGILNLSLAYPVQGRPLDHADLAYQRLCQIMARALSRFGLNAQAQAVEGSFCDGRFNLACIDGDQVRKIAGTAQLWRKQPLPDGQGHKQVVLVHGLLLVTTDIAAITARANALEEALDHTRRYLPERAASLDTLLSPSAGAGPALISAVVEALRDSILSLTASDCSA